MLFEAGSVGTASGPREALPNTIGVVEDMFRKTRSMRRWSQAFPIQISQMPGREVTELLQTSTL